MTAPPDDDPKGGALLDTRGIADRFEKLIRKTMFRNYSGGVHFDPVNKTINVDEPDDMNRNEQPRWRCEYFEAAKPFIDAGEWPGQDRIKLATRYAWAIPCEAAIRKLVEIADAQPYGLLEVGAGSGYWAHHVACMGGKILATDCDPPKTGRNTFGHRTAYYDVAAISGHSAADAYGIGRALFMCWPPYDTPAAYDALSAYRGSTLVYVGEGSGGCNGDDRFWDLLEEQWKLREVIEIPQWPGLNDAMRVFDEDPQEVPIDPDLTIFDL